VLRLISHHAAGTNLKAAKTEAESRLPTRDSVRHRQRAPADVADTAEYQSSSQSVDTTRAGVRANSHDATHLPLTGSRHTSHLTGCHSYTISARLAKSSRKTVICSAADRHGILNA